MAQAVSSPALASGRPRGTRNAKRPPTPMIDATTALFTGAVKIAQPVAIPEQDEAVTLRNADTPSINLTNWILMPGEGANYNFPAFVLGPNITDTTHVCKGHNHTATLYWGRCQPTFPITGGTAMPHDA